MATWIEDHRVKIRRATRHDLDAIGALLGTSIPTRFGRRAMADRRDDVYVAAEADGDLVGVLGLAYRRSLARAGVVVDVDPLAGVRDSVVVGLLEFAIERARGRGAVRVVVAEPGASGATATACEDRWRPERTRALSLRGVG